VYQAEKPPLISAQRQFFLRRSALVLTLAAAGSARADLATPEQKRACTPGVYRLCPGEIPNVRAITNCLRRQRGEPQRRLPGGIRAVRKKRDRD
jgi:hypothetical protein